MYDAIIIGARCAGSSTAMLLSRKGYRVLLVDRATFPSDTISGHFIQAAGVARLKQWGILDKLSATNCPPLLSFTFDLGDFSLTGTPPPIDGISEGYGPRRFVFDKILVDAAVDAGAELRESFTVEELLWEDNRVTGIRGHTKGSSTVTEKARVVIGADGAYSFVARSVQSPQYNINNSYTCSYYSYWSGINISNAELYPRNNRFIVAMPTNDGLTLVAALWSKKEFAEFRSDIENNLLKTIAEHAPNLSERISDGYREERFYGTAGMPNFFRKPFGQGWALAGDAGYHKDPITAQGMTDSFRDAELLATALDESFAGNRTLEEALSDYERQRNEAVKSMYEFTCELAQLAPPPQEMRELLFALQGQQHHINRFFGVMAGTVPVNDFYSPENMQNIIEASRLSIAA